jgi:hypothetical protein
VGEAEVWLKTFTVRVPALKAPQISENCYQGESFGLMFKVLRFVPHGVTVLLPSDFLSYIAAAEEREALIVRSVLRVKASRELEGSLCRILSVSALGCARSLAWGEALET